MQEISSIKDKILYYLDKKGITRYRFYKDTGVTRGILDQKNGITEDNLLKFINYAQDISLEWLLLGVGDMLKDHQTKYKEPEPKGVEIIYKNLFEKQKEEIKQLNREVGKLLLTIEQLKSQSASVSLAADAKTKYKDKE